MKDNLCWYDFNFTIQSYELQKWKGIPIQMYDNI